MYRNVLITGGARGLGLAIAKDCAKNFSQIQKIILVDINENELSKAESSINAEWPTMRVEKICVDITNTEKMIELFSQRDEIDLVIANAGIGGINPITDFSPFHVHKMFQVNTLGTVNTFAPFISHMIKKKRGTLVAICSLSGLRGLPGASGYSPSKVAQSAFCESIRSDLKEHNVHVITAFPGFIKTKMAEHDEFEMPFTVSVEEASASIICAIKKKKRRYYFPKSMAIIAFIGFLLPSFLFDILVGQATKKAKKGTTQKNKIFL